MTKFRTIVNLTRGTVVCEQALLADGPLLRMRGLMGRRELARDAGMLLRPAPAIHSAFMRFAIDAVFLDTDLLVMRVVDELRPWRMAAQRGAHAVLELAGGERARRAVAVGDRLALLDGELERTAWSAQLLPADERDGQHGGGAEGPPDAQDSMRVLVAASDRRFRHTASLLLSRRGCETSVADSFDRVAEPAIRGDAEVIVLDAGNSLTEAARTVALLEALSPPVGVVVVADNAERGLLHLPVFDRWGSFDALFAAVEDAHAHRAQRRSLLERD